jgi:hypothetical protein
MNRLLAVVAMGAVTLGACQKENDAEEPIVDPAKSPSGEPVRIAEVAISSVSMTGDCPDPEPVQEAKRARPQSEAEASAVEGDSDRYSVPPCQQSMIQLSFTGQGESSTKVLLKEVRVLGPDGSVLGTAKSRNPTEWKNNVYTPWDQMLKPKTDAVVAYKLGIPTWASPEAQSSGSSYGTMMRVEVDVVIGDVTKTVKSGEYTREPEEMVET